MKVSVKVSKCPDLHFNWSVTCSKHESKRVEEKSARTLERLTADCHTVYICKDSFKYIIHGGNEARMQLENIF